MQLIGLTRSVLQIVMGQKDTVVAVAAADEFHAESVAEDKTLLKYNDGYHMLLQDTPEVTARLMQDLGNWLLQHLPAA
jgi:alpha-beta hydrolase superfamily lysophospholipase